MDKAHCTPHVFGPVVGATVAFDELSIGVAVAEYFPNMSVKGCCQYLQSKPNSAGQ